MFPLNRCPLVMLVTCGSVLSIVNVAPVVFPAVSIASNTYISSVPVVYQLVIDIPFNVPLSVNVSVIVPV